MSSDFRNVLKKTGLRETGAGASADASDVPAAADVPKERTKKQARSQLKCELQYFCISRIIK
jgi:hypothetical protein